MLSSAGTIYLISGANSGIGQIEGTSDDVARALFEVNFWGATNVSHKAIRIFRDENKPSGGRLLQASSGVGIYKPWLGLGTIVLGIFQALSSELHPSWNITITIIELGAFDTGAVQNSMVTVPPHPAYTLPNSVPKAVRNYLLAENFAFGDNPAIGAKEIRKIGLDASTGLRLPLGLGALEAMSRKLSLLQKDLGGAIKWSAR